MTYIKAHIYTWKGHTKGVAAVRWFPQTAHLFLSAGMDCRVKVNNSNNDNFIDSY